MNNGQNDKIFVKVWNLTRNKKTVVYVEGSNEEDLVLKVIAKGSEKLQINGSRLVLEKDGTEIDDTAILQYFKDEVFMVLESEEIWAEEMAQTASVSSSNNMFSVNTSHSTTTTTTAEVLNEVVEVPSEDSQQIITYQIDANAEFLWHCFEIPWELIPTSMISNCEKGIKDPLTITCIIHTVLNKMREIKPNLPTTAIKIVTKKIIDKFPDIFRDIDEDGIVIGDGTYTVFKKLQDRNNYLNRPHKRKSLALQPSDADNPVVNKKIRTCHRAGCISFEPPVTEIIDKSDLLSESSTPNFEEMFLKSYPQQRNFLNKNPTYNEIQEEWPMLLKNKAALLHFKELTKCDLNGLPIASEQKFPKFERLAMSSKVKVNWTNPKTLNIFLIVSNYFRENPSTFYKEAEKKHQEPDQEPQSTPELQSAAKEVAGMHPVILKYNDEEKYLLFYEQNKLNEYDNFNDAFLMAFALFFNLNLQFPSGNGQTFEFFQRYFLKIHPDTGSKCPKKKGKTRVITLMNRMRNL